jgi:hypothetical protein
MIRFALDCSGSARVTLNMRSDGDSRFLAFFDECGDHSMEKIDRDFPLFVLALVVMERATYRDRALPEFNGFKLRYFTHEGINLHSRDIRLATGPFGLLQNPEVRPKFMGELGEIVERVPFTLFISAIRKGEYLARQGRDAVNPYDLGLTFTLEALTAFMEELGETRLPMVAEARGKREDNALEQAFYRTLARGTAQVSVERFKRLDCALTFQPKKNNIIGVQLADLCAHPCARHILNPERPSRAFEVARKHVYAGGKGGGGWKVFP